MKKGTPRTPEQKQNDFDWLCENFTAQQWLDWLDDKYNPPAQKPV